MAKLFFVGLDGAEKSYRLQTHRPFTLGRDPATGHRSNLWTERPSATDMC